MPVGLRTLAALVTAITLLAAATIHQFDAAPYLRPQRLIDIGGRRLNLYCTGSGSPAVILDTDQDGSTVDWRLVQPQIAKDTQVCSYDAAGLGFSDPTQGPRDAAAYVADLHALLAHAHIGRPYVLVGYAFSGMSARLYADRYASELAGMVLVDPLIPYRNQRLAALIPKLAPLANNSGGIRELEMCRAAALEDRLRPGTAAFKTCMWTTGPGDPTLPSAVRDVLQQQWRRPQAWEDLISAARADNQSSAEVERAQRSYGHMPLIVLSSDPRADVHGMPLSKSDVARLTQAYEAWQNQVTKLSTIGVHHIVPGSTTSDIVTKRAAVVVSAILKTVDEVRQDGGPTRATR